MLQCAAMADFARVRAAARVAIGAAVTSALGPGWVRAGARWTCAVEGGDAQVAVQGGQAGFYCYINLTRPGRRPQMRRLGQFYRREEATTAEAGRIFYLAVQRDPSDLTVPMAILRDRGLPWLQGLTD